MNYMEFTYRGHRYRSYLIAEEDTWGFSDWIKDNSVTERPDEDLNPGDTTEMDAFLAGFNNKNDNLRGVG